MRIESGQRRQRRHRGQWRDRRQLQRRQRQRRRAGRGLVTCVVLAIVLVAAPACTVSDSAVDRLAAGREAFERFEFHQAKGAFAAVLAEDPASAEAAYAFARTTMTLNEFDEAIPAFERALALEPDNPLAHEGYLFSLVWGGKLRGKRDWLDRALESGGDTVRRFPDLAAAYDLIEEATGEVNEPEMWLQILASLEPEIGHSPVFQVHHLGALLAQARSSGDADAAQAVELRLDDTLADYELGDAADADDAGPGAGAAAAARRYLLAYGSKLLQDTERQLEWLARLEELPEGRHLAAKMTHFDGNYMPFMRAREETTAQRLERLERWEARFPATWDNPDFTTRRVPMGMRQQLMIEALNARLAVAEDTGTDADTDADETMGADAAPESPAEASADPFADLADAQLVDAIVELGEAIGRLDTWGSAGSYAYTARQVLEARPEASLRLAETALARLEAGESGILYPGTAPEAQEAERSNALAGLTLVRGEALAAIGRSVEAEEAIRAAAAEHPRADRHAALGELLIAQQRDDEGYPALVNALAWNAEEPRIDDDAPLRETALAAATRLGGSEESFARDLEDARRRVAEERTARIVGDRLDMPAPDFQLTDTDGNEWRLSALVGKVVVLNYWATWCGPCRVEFPHYDELVDEYAEADDVVFLAITTDADASVPRKFLDEFGYDFTVLFDEGSATDYHVTGIPSHFIIGPEGRIQYRAGGFPGPERYAREMRLRIEALRPTDTG